MATFTSSWRTYGSGAQWRLVLVISDPPVVTKDTSSVLVTATGSIQTTSSLSDSSNVQNLGGAIEAVASNVTVSHGAGGGTTQVVSGSASISTVYGQPVGVTVAFAINGYEAFSGLPAQVSGLVTIPARPYQVPSAPTSVSVSRNSDTSHTVTWTRNVSTAAPYQSQQVQRSTDGGGWATVATVAGTATSWTDTTTSADHSYAYRVRAVNSSGTTASSPSSTVYTTPKAPGTPTASRSGSNIVLTFTNTARHDEGIKVYESQDGGAFSLLATVATPNLTSYTHVGPDPAKTHRYRVATYRGALISAQSAASNTVQLAAPPNAPTNLAPTSVHDATEDVTLTWRHNPVDSSPQGAFEVRHRAQGAGSWTTTGKVTSAATGWTLPGGTYANPTTVEWQVRTWGQHADPSSWSATATLPTSARPTATIVAPADESTVDTSTVTVEWAYYDAEATSQAAWEVELRDGQGQLVEALAGAGDVTSTTLATVLPDGTAWALRVRVRDGAGLWSAWDEATFGVDYAEPPVPSLSATWDPETASVTLAVDTPAPGDETAVLVTDDDGEPCVELIDPVGGGGGYLYALVNAADTPGVGRWVAFGVDVKPLTEDQASRMRLYARTQSGSTTVDEQYSPTGVGWTAGQWTRQVVSVQQTGAADNIDAIIWPTQTPNPGAQFRARRAVVVFADTQEEAEALAAAYWDGVATNLVTNPKPSSLSGWSASGDETAVLVTDDDGEPCVELIDPVGGGSGTLFAALNMVAAPGVGRWVAFGIDVKPLSADQATRMRLHVRTQVGGTTSTSTSTTAGAGWTAGQWTRQVVSVQQQSADADRITAVVWPTQTPNPGPQFRARRAVVVFADTQEEAEALAAAYWDGVATNLVTNPKPSSLSGWSASGGEVAAESVDVWRQIDDGPWALIATGVPPSSTVTDWSPTVAGTTRYRVDAISAIPSVSTSDEVDVITPQPGDPPGAVWISGGPGYSQVCRLMSNVQISSRPARARARRRYAGRDYPVAHVGDALSHILTLTGEHIPAAGHGDSTAAEWEALALLPGPFLWRDPEGRYLPVDIDVQVDREVSGVAYRIQVTAEVVDG